MSKDVPNTYRKESDSVLLLGYDRPIAGREKHASDLLDEMFGFLEKAKAAGRIVAFDAVSLAVHGGNLNGFVLIRGDRKALDDFRASEEFDDLSIRAHMVMTGVSVLSGVHGELVKTRRIDRVRKLSAKLR
jgi:hypothetical protein